MAPMQKPKGTNHASAAGPRNMPAWLPWLVLPALVAIAYHGVWHAGFTWDDDQHLTENPCIVGPLGFRDIWTSSHARICPLVISSFWLQHAIWGLNPLPYHLVNVAMHCGAALVLWRVLLALGVRGAWLGAALWALHPVQVETVAWITELKNTQSALFYSLCILYFLRWLRSPPEAHRRWWNYCWMLLFAMMALASKSSTVVLPVILALCAWWVDRSWRWRTMVGIMPVLALAALAAALALWTQQLEGANEPEWHRSMAERVTVTGHVVWFYLGKLLWPSPLIFIYPRWTVDPAQFMAWVPLLAVVIAGTLLWWRRDGRLRPVFMAAACFVAALLPVLGLLEHYFLRYSFVGDHFQYLASMAPLALAGAGLASLPRLINTHHPWAAALPATLVVIALTLVTIRRVPVFASAETLWADTIAQNPAAWIAQNNLGSVLLRSGRAREAIPRFREALRLYPNHVRAMNNLAMALLKDGGSADEVVALCRKALALRASSPDALTNLGNALLLQGQQDEAAQAWRDALKSDPGYAEAHINLCVALLNSQQVDEALAHGEKAVLLRPKDAAAHSVLGSALRAKGRVDEAIGHFQTSIQLRPEHAGTLNNLANALQQQGRSAEAIPQYAKAAELMPDSIPVLNNYAWAIATCPDEKSRNGPRAIETSLRCLELFGSDNPSLMRTLAAGYAADGKFDHAREIVERALNLLGVNDDPALSAKLREDVELYRSGKPRTE
jgi:tetratricopeptide (TPR) repeat protein